MSELYSSTAQSSLKKFPTIKNFRALPILHSPKHNHLLALLPVKDYVRLLPHMELIQMKVGDVLYESGMPIEWIYFPTTSVVCLAYIAENGSLPAVGVVGNDGMIGIAYVMGSNSSSTFTTVQSTGVGYRIRASVIKKELQRSSELMRISLLYAQTFFTQVLQTAVCNRLHSLDQQLCRWLLMSRDRLGADEMHLTQELIANMLGVRREGVTHAAGKLRDKGLIKYSRGNISILDRQGMEKEVCECYGVVSKECARLLPPKNTLSLSQAQKVVAVSSAKKANTPPQNKKNILARKQASC